MEVEIGEYRISQTLGKGTFGKVRLAIHKRTGEQVAIKILEKSKIANSADSADIERVSREIHIMKFVRHPNVVQLYDLIETPKYLMLVMEYGESGDLFQHIIKHKRLSENEACMYYHQLINAVEYIHKLKFVHRDIKPENLLLDYNNTLKLVDFGLSNTCAAGELLKTPCGSLCYAAPEMLSQQSYGPEVDIWSTGVVLYTLLCGCLPFESEDNVGQLSKNILAGKYELTTTVSGEAQDLLSRVLQVDPHKRYTVQQIRNHPWMRRAASQGHGIIVGYNQIPVDSRIVDHMVQLGYSADRVRHEVEANRHNSTTAAYYLLLKKLVKGGLESSCCLSSKNFNASLIQPPPRTSREQLRNQSVLRQLLQSQLQSQASSQLEPMSISVNKRPKTALQSLEADKENQPNDVNRRRSKSKANKPLGKTSIRIEEPNRGRDLLTPANRIAVHFKEQLGKSLLSKSHERKTSKSTRKSERPRINLLMEPGDKKARPFCGTGRPPHNAHNPRQILEISNNMERGGQPYLGREHKRGSCRRVSVGKQAQTNQSLDLNGIVEKYYTHHRA